MSTGGRDVDPHDVHASDADLSDADLSDVEAWLRAARAELPALSVGPWFAQSVRVRARRRRARVRAAGSVAAVVTAVVVLLVSVGLLGGGVGTNGIAPASTVAPGAPGAHHSYGGITVTWLPEGTKHLSDKAGSDVMRSSEGGVLGYFAYLAGRDTQGLYASTFGPSDGGDASELKVGVNWYPGSISVAGLQAALHGATPTPTTVGGEPAVRLSTELPANISGGGETHLGALFWSVGDGGPLLVVSVRDVAPLDWAEIKRVAEGVQLGREPNTVDPRTVDQVKAAFNTVYLARNPPLSDEAWGAAVQDPAEILPVRGRVAQRYPGLVATISIAFGSMTQDSPTTVSVSFTLTFTDKALPATTSDGKYSLGTTGTAVLVDGHWLVSRDTYCSKVDMLPMSDLKCP
ncbi:hypothetical protein [Pseudofrankia sp. BMG5.36]|uniref:hypothetical protein n=1 Tax=Pseudofrankia sp. BMG5.36 TaxID=1834512 RepID=UPI000B18B766|nr:hypothetical protein [Pseudofrankia sp. BMG5.36]